MRYLWMAIPSPEKVLTTIIQQKVKSRRRRKGKRKTWKLLLLTPPLLLQHQTIWGTMYKSYNWLAYWDNIFSQFPMLTCEEERQRYKQIFNKEYVDYLKLKDSIDQVSDQNQKECSALSERLDSVAKHSDEYKVSIWLVFKHVTKYLPPPSPVQIFRWNARSTLIQLSAWVFEPVAATAKLSPIFVYACLASRNVMATGNDVIKNPHFTNWWKDLWNDVHIHSWVFGGGYSLSCS